MSCRCVCAGSLFPSRSTGRITRYWTAVLAVAAGLVFAQVAQAETPITRVEEDWELVVELPETNTDAPQVTTVISPGGDLFGVYASFELNHHTQPEYSAGGLQLQLWNTGVPVATSTNSNQALLQHNSETIRWTQRMSLYDGWVSFRVVNGTSTTWGDFGGYGSLWVWLPSQLTTLAGYNPGFSTGHSGIGYAENRVRKLVLREVRLYSADGLVASDSTERVVHSQE